MRFRFGPLILLLLICSTASAQLRVDWQPRADLNAGLPANIRIYQADAQVQRGGNLDPLRAFLVRADTTSATWKMRALRSTKEPGVETTSSFAVGSQALVAVNGGYFGGGQSYSFVAEDGQVKSQNIGAISRPAGTYYPTRSAFALLNSGRFDVAWIYNVSGTTYAYSSPSPNTEAEPQPQPSATFPQGGAPWPFRTGIGGGPVLVENGQRRVAWAEEVFFGSGIGDATTSLQPRTAVGYTATGELLLMVVDGRQPASAGVTLVELADLFLQLGAVEAMNLDGGGSSTMVASGTLVNRPEGGTFQRAVASALVLAPKTTSGGGETEEFIFDTGDHAYREAGSWIESGNTPFWGATKARLNVTGTGQDRAVFRLEGMPAGTYEVSAWWVASSNRAMNTPYTIYSGGNPNTVRVNQTLATTNDRWNALGTFTLAPGDSIVVTDDAVGSMNPAYVVVDAVRLSRQRGSSVDEASAGNASLRVFPNPSRGAFNLEFEALSMVATGRVYDLLGRVVHRFEVEAGTSSYPLHLPDLSPGLYLVYLDTPGGTLRRPLTLLR